MMLIRRFLPLALLAALIFPPSIARADDAFDAEVARETDPAACGGTLVVDETQFVANNLDRSLTTGAYWAFDTSTQNYRIWQTGSDTFCRIRIVEGTFETFGETSPGGTGVLQNKVVGTFRDYSRSRVFTGVLRPTRPPLGETVMIDARCDQNGQCPGRPSLIGRYFSTWSGYDEAWYAGIYDGGQAGIYYETNHGSWGDIIG